jgi:hypothetical protein
MNIQQIIDYSTRYKCTFLEAIADRDDVMLVAEVLHAFRVLGIPETEDNLIAAHPHEFHFVNGKATVLQLESRDLWQDAMGDYYTLCKDCHSRMTRKTEGFCAHCEEEAERQYEDYMRSRESAYWIQRGRQ